MLMYLNGAALEPVVLVAHKLSYYPQVGTWSEFASLRRISTISYNSTPTAGLKT
jgi:hypothetical protein